MAWKNPPVKRRFTTENQPTFDRHQDRGPYLTPKLKKAIKKKIKYDDPSGMTKTQITGKVEDAIIWRLILNACQGENDAIKEIFNRIDGKNADIVIDQSKHYHLTAERRKEKIENIRKAFTKGLT